MTAPSPIMSQAIFFCRVAKNKIAPMRRIAIPSGKPNESGINYLLYNWLPPRYEMQ
jgi:hypothetical protein